MPNTSSPVISVINPNSNEAVTRGLEEAMRGLVFKDGPKIDCTTLAEGPFGIETQAHVDDVVAPLRSLVEKDNAASAFVIAGAGLLLTTLTQGHLAASGHQQSHVDAVRISLFGMYLAQLTVGVLVPVSGVWRLFLQCRVGGRVLTAPFTLHVR